VTGSGCATQSCAQATSSTNAGTGRAEPTTLASDLALLDATNLVIYRDSTLKAGGRVVQLDGLTLIIGTHPSPSIVNTILPTGPLGDPASSLAEAVEVYRSIGHGTSLVTGDHADAELARVASHHGWTCVFELVGMILDRPIPADALLPLAAGTAIREADPVADLAAIRAVEVMGFAESDHERSMVESVFGDPRILDSPGTAAYLASIEDPAGPVVAAVAVVERGPAALITWVATLPDFRRRGLGGRVTAAAANRGFEMGCPAVVLQASPLGLSVYRRLGFRELGRYQIWEPPRH
jgi:ribosomal protein S18 acetylase RimI-like enzyme